MSPIISTPMVLFALRDLARRPGESALLALALGAVVTILAIPLLLYQGLEQTARSALSEAPSLVVRRLDPGGFAPLPAAEGLLAARGLRGVTEARARRWGVVEGGGRPVTVVGVDDLARRELLALGLEPPGEGTALVGPALAPRVSVGERLELRGLRGLAALRVNGRLPARLAGAVAHDLVLVTWEEAGEVLGLPEGGASDLALWVFHDTEEAAIRGPLQAAMPWPVRITGRGEATRAALGDLGRRSGLSLFSALPAILALVLLMVAVAWHHGREGRREAALLKMLGWASSDVVRLRLAQAALLGVPALAAGLALASSLVLFPGVPAVTGAALGWSGPPPPLSLDPRGALVVLVVVAGVVLVPWLAAAVVPAVAVATVDPGELLDE